MVCSEEATLAKGGNKMAASFFVAEALDPRRIDDNEHAHYAFLKNKDPLGIRAAK